MLSCGFKIEQYDKSKHDVYFKEPVCNFQMHISLFEEDSKDILYNYFKEIDKRLVTNENSNFGRQFITEDFYLYIKAHEYKHYSNGGTGLRSLVDTYLYIKKYGKVIDWEYLGLELTKLGIYDYEKNVACLSKICLKVIS